MTGVFSVPWNEILFLLSTDGCRNVLQWVPRVQAIKPSGLHAYPFLLWWTTMAYGRTDTTGSGPANRWRVGDTHQSATQSVDQLGLPAAAYVRSMEHGRGCSIRAGAGSIHRKIRSSQQSAEDHAKLRAVAWKAEARHGRMSPESPSAATSRRSPLAWGHWVGVGRHL